MRHTSEYLFDEPVKYFEPELTVLADKKIASARKLKKKLSATPIQGLTSEMIEELQIRYAMVDNALKWWEEVR